MTVELGQYPQSFEALAEVGLSPEGRNCLGYSKEEDEAHNRARQMMEEIGMETEVDPWRNLHGYFFPDESSRDLPTVAMGSHLDSVPNGGVFDGVLGVAAAIEAVKRIKEKIENGEISLRSPLEIIAFRSEESSRFGKSCLGSGFMTGKISSEDIDRLKNRDALLEALGVSEETMPNILNGIFNLRNQMRAYLELHVEQSDAIEREIAKTGEQMIGVVCKGIAGASRDSVRIKAPTFHTGSLPMAERKGRDMAVAAAEIILMVRSLASTFDANDNPFRATVNIMNLEGKSPNVGSGRELLMLDTRALYPERMDEGRREIFRRMYEIMGRYPGAELLVDPMSFTPACRLGDDVPELVESSSKSLGVPFMRLPSMAGHDAGNMGRIFPAGMIFLESEGGVSHDLTENTTPEQVELGIRVLTESVVRIANTRLRSEQTDGIHTHLLPHRPEKEGALAS